MLAACLTAVLPLLALEPNPDDFYEPPLLEIGGPPPCNDDRDCEFDGQPFCHPDLEQCTECLTADHCPEGWSCDDSGGCFDACKTSEDCDGTTGKTVCNPDLGGGQCVECLTESDCEEAEYCQAYVCLDDHCTPGERLCFGLTLMECGPDGGSTTKVEHCDVLCQHTEDGAECLGDGGSTGGGGGGGSTTGPIDGSDDAGPTNEETGAAATGPGGGGTSMATNTDGQTSEPGDGGEGTSSLPETESCACRSDGGSNSGWMWLWMLAVPLAYRRRILRR